MSTVISDFVTIPGDPTVDPFGGLRVSHAAMLFESKSDIVSNGHRTEDVVVAGGALATPNATTSTVRLSTTTASGDRVLRQSAWSIPYLPGRGMRAHLTAVFGPPQSNCVKRIGAFDNNNGIFLAETNGELTLVRRTKTSGSVVDTPVAQASWNLDTLDGTGPSKINLDVETCFLLWIDWGWQGVRPPRVGVMVNGKFAYAHQFDIGSLVVPWSQTGNTRVRWEIENTGASTATYLDAICGVAFSEGGADFVGAQHGISTVQQSVTFRSATADTRTQLLSVRVRSGKELACFRPISLDVITDSAANFRIQLTRGGTLTNASWVDFGDTMEFDASATAISGDEAIWSGLAASGAQSSKSLSTLMSEILFYGSTYDGTRTAVNIVATPLATNEAFHASLNVQEYY